MLDTIQILLFPECNQHAIRESQKVVMRCVLATDEVPTASPRIAKKVSLDPCKTIQSLHANVRQPDSDSTQGAANATDS